MAADVGGQLKRWRTRLRLTQKEVAERLGISRERYANWENGKSNPPPAFMAQLIELGFQNPWILQESRKPYGEASPSTVKLAVETLFDKESSDEVRRLAREELYRILEIEPEPSAH